MGSILPALEPGELSKEATGKIGLCFAPTGTIKG